MFTTHVGNNVCVHMDETQEVEAHGWCQTAQQHAAEDQTAEQEQQLLRGMDPE